MTHFLIIDNSDHVIFSSFHILHSFFIFYSCEKLTFWHYTYWIEGDCHGCYTIRMKLILNHKWESLSLVLYFVALPTKHKKTTYFAKGDFFQLAAGDNSCESTDSQLLLQGKVTIARSRTSHSHTGTVNVNHHTRYCDSWHLFQRHLSIFLWGAIAICENEE